MDLIQLEIDVVSQERDDNLKISIPIFLGNLKNINTYFSPVLFMLFFSVRAVI